MAYKNQDHVREERLYAYMSLIELEQFQQAMAIRNMGQPCTALREFALERSEQIIIENRKKDFSQSTAHIQTVNYLFPNGKFTDGNNSPMSQQLA